MTELTAAIDAALPTDFSGIVRVDARAETLAVVTRGFADRARRRPIEPDSRFLLASVAKGLTALTVVSLIADGVLALDTTARSVLGGDLPLIDDEVTVEHLLAHRSGIGDYFDEEAIESMSDYVMPEPVHRYDRAEAYLPTLDGHPQVTPPGQQFTYNNAGFVVLALLAERAAGVPITELVATRVTAPANASRLDLARTDEPEADDVTHYLDADGPRTNILHLPVQGVGDGGARGTVEDLHRLWTAVMAGHVVPTEWVERMTEPSGPFDPGADRYGLGCWLDAEGPGVAWEGYDAGISARTHHNPDSDVTWTVLSNWTDGAWPIAGALPDILAQHGIQG